jgi:hypothetical protein
MFKKSLTFILTVLVFNLFLSGVAFAASKEEKAAKLAVKVKAGVEKLGSGKDAKVEIKLYDKTKLKGYIDQIGENSFSVTDSTSGSTTEVSYRNVKQIKGNNLTVGKAIVIGVVALLVIGAIAYIFSSEG